MQNLCCRDRGTGLSCRENHLVGKTTVLCGETGGNMSCKEREQLRKVQQEAFEEWYKHRSELERLATLKKHSSMGKVRLVADQAYTRLRQSMDALISHNREHDCRKGR